MYFEVYPTEEQEGPGLLASLVPRWRWRLKADNNETIASGEAYNSKQSCLHAVELIRATTKDTPVKEVGL